MELLEFIRDFFSMAASAVTEEFTAFVGTGEYSVGDLRVDLDVSGGQCVSARSVLSESRRGMAATAR